MLARMRFIPQEDLGQPGGALYPYQIDGNLPQRSLHRVEQRNGEALDAGEMGGPEHDHAANTTVRRAKKSVDGRGDGAGIDVAGVRDDRRLERPGFGVDPRL